MHYFGYGSLVNRFTRPGDEVFDPVTIKGWTRQWAHRVPDSRAEQFELLMGSTAVSTGLGSSSAVRGFSVLTVAPCEDTEIDGVAVGLAKQDLPALDERERGYERHTVRAPLSSNPVAMYVSKSEHVAMASNHYPLLQSYVDCVLAGFHQIYGWDGVHRFFASTQGWAAPMIADREKPLYPRAVQLPLGLLAEIDDAVAAAQIQS